MKKVLLVCVAVVALTPVISAQNLPTLTQFLSECFRDSRICHMKLKDYVNASVSQKTMCLPNDVSVNDAADEMLHWLRAEDAHPASFYDAPYDDGLYAATQKLYPCAPRPDQQPVQQ